MNFNKILIGGNLTKPVNIKYLPSGDPVAQFSVAVNKKWKDKKSGEMKSKVTFVEVVAWGKLAEICNQYLTKGSPVFVEGEIEQQVWKDKDTGANRSKIIIRAANVKFIGAKKEGGQEQPAADDSFQAEEQ